MIMEDYCSYEVAKLLKDKGFNESIRCWYDNFQDFHEEGVRMSNNDCLPPTIMCPTHQMAMKWLREKKIFINVWYDKTDFSAEYVNGYFNYIGNFDSYEEAVEQSIKYVLEHVI